MEIVIIDSGVNCSHPEFVSKRPYGINFINLLNGGNIYDIEDNIGHGTAVYGIINKIVPQADIFVLKVFDKSYEIDENILIQALEYIKDFNMNIIHMSNGIPKLNNYKHLKEIIDYFYQKGVIIISSFDNCGCFSFPAGFDNVIGIDSTTKYINNKDYEYIEGSLINIRSKGSMQRVCWNNPNYMLVSGSSFASPYITGIVASWLCENHCLTFREVLNKLKQNSKESINFNNTKSKNYLRFKIHKAIVFPVNKEIYPLFVFNNLCPFSITGAYTDRLLGSSGKMVHDYIHREVQFDMLIKPIDSIDWINSDFDTIILGHCSELSIILEKNFLAYFIQNAIKYHKNIYAFDNLEKYIPFLDKNNIKYFYPSLEKKDVPQGRFNKLFLSSKPIIGIFGTSSKQGKFNLQLILRELLQKNGYKVGQLGTEPSSFLFDFDEIFAFGYDSTIALSTSEAILKLNDSIHNIETKDKDIIIVGSQGGTIPFSTYNIDSIPKNQEQLLAAIDFDLIILCINPFDPDEYVKRTIQYIESYADVQIGSLILYPFIRTANWSPNSNLYKKLSQEELLKIKKQQEETFNKPVFINGDTNDMLKLYETIINIFSK